MIEVAANRAAQKWSRRELFGRMLWAAVYPLFRLSPRPFWAWRAMMLRMFGANVGSNVHVYPTVRIMIPWNLTLGDFSAVGDRAILYALGPVSIGERATVSSYAYLCAGSHNWRDPSMPLTKPEITIGSDSWICTGAFIGPAVRVGDNSIIGACAVVVRNVEPGTLVAGNPAREVGRREV